MAEVSQRGVFTIALEEGVVPATYYDKVGVKTWGIGHTAAAGAPDPADMSMRMPTKDKLGEVVAQAFEVLDNDIDAYSSVILQKFGPMKQHELDGWTSWHINTGGAYRSSAAKKWRAGDKVGAVNTMKQWNKVTRKGRKEVSDVLVKRRQVEANMILKGKYPGGQVPVWGTDGKGRVIWKAIDRLSFDDVDMLTRGRNDRTRPFPKGRAGAAAGGLGAALIAAWITIGDKIAEFIERLF